MSILIAAPFNAQETMRIQDVNLEWIDDYYLGDSILKKRLQNFYKDLNEASNPFETEALFYELRDLCESLTYGIELMKKMISCHTKMT